VICLYAFDQADRPNARPLGGAARWWLVQSLRALQASLHTIGSSLVLRQGPAVEIIPALAQEAGAQAVYWNEIAQAPSQAQAGQVSAHLEAIGVASQSFPGDLLVTSSISAPRRAVACGCSRRSGSGCRRWAIRRSRCRRRRR
jgi:deoxyribodipyrimidine photo-lyase